MEYMVHHARHVPFSTQVMVDEDELMELIDEFRFNLPEEIKEAVRTVQQKQRMISEAHTEAGRIMESANQRAEQAVSGHEVHHRAERQAQHLLAEARSESERIIREAERYARDQLQQLEAQLRRTLNEVRRGLEVLQAAEEEGARSSAPVEATAD
jgi:regulator of protease activity HflC (stomatin/prohibitin superfamily)